MPFLQNNDIKMEYPKGRKEQDETYKYSFKIDDEDENNINYYDIDTASELKKTLKANHVNFILSVTDEKGIERNVSYKKKK